MQLNSISGRTYNDLAQYPVFPWILADYFSENIDLNDESIYRDLSKPTGALNESRAKEIKTRFVNLCFRIKSLPWHHPWSIPSALVFLAPPPILTCLLFIIPEMFVPQLPSTYKTAYYVSVLEEKQIDYSKNSFSRFQKQFKRALWRITFFFFISEYSIF